MHRTGRIVGSFSPEVLLTCLLSSDHGELETGALVSLLDSSDHFQSYFPAGRHYLAHAGQKNAGRSQGLRPARVSPKLSSDHFDRSAKSGRRRAEECIVNSQVHTARALSRVFS